MKRRLEDKVAIVVGASTRGEGVGNGKATAIQFAREGAKVLCVDRDEPAADDTRDAIRSEGGEAETCVADITNVKDCQRIVDTCIQHFGKLDVLHNNVGVGGGQEIVDATEEEWDRAFDYQRLVYSFSPSFARSYLRYIEGRCKCSHHLYCSPLRPL